MGKYNELVEDHLNARITRNKLASDTLGVLKGEVETALKTKATDADATTEQLAKAMVKGLELVGGEQSKEEIELLQPYLPATLSEAQIKAELDELDLTKLSNVGAKMGRAMVQMKGRADGNDVKNVILKYYN